MLMLCHLTPPCRMAVSPALRGPANFRRISSFKPLYSVSPRSASVTHAPPGRAMLDMRPRFHFFPAFWMSTKKWNLGLMSNMARHETQVPFLPGFLDVHVQSCYFNR